MTTPCCAMFEALTAKYQRPLYRPTSFGSRPWCMKLYPLWNGALAEREGCLVEIEFCPWCGKRVNGATPEPAEALAA